MANPLDIYVIYKFIRILATPFKETDAYKLGIIDEKGKILRKRKDLTTKEEKKANTVLHTLVWKLKRVLDKIPFVRSKLGSFAAALWLIKEETGVDQKLLEDSFMNFLLENNPSAHAEITRMTLLESTFKSPTIPAGTYSLLKRPSGGEKKLIIEHSIEPIGRSLGIPVYKYKDMLFTQYDIKG